MGRLIDKCVCSDCSTSQPLPHVSLPRLASLYSLRYNIEVRPIPNSIMVSKCSSESMNHSLSLEMIKLSEEGMLKAEIG